MRLLRFLGLLQGQHLCAVWCQFTCSVQPCYHQLWSLLRWCAHGVPHSHRPASVDFTRFQHLCCVHSVEVPMHDCSLCADPQTMGKSVALPCCHQRMHYWCLVHSVHACGDGCPFCTRDLLPFLTDPLVATSLAHHNLSLDLQRAPSNSLVNSLHGLNLPPEPDIWPLRCTRTSGPPDFAPVDDCRMQWSPLQRLNGSATLVGAPFLWTTSPRWTWFRALLAPLPQVLCSTDQLEGLFVSVSPVAEKSTSHHNPTPTSSC